MWVRWNLMRFPQITHADVEQSAFAPSHVVDGIGLSPDKLLQGRILAYPDAHRYRLGANYEQIPVNRPVNPVRHHQRDGFMSVDGNGEDTPNYFPNSFDDIEADKSYKEPAFKLDGDIADSYDRNENDDDHYSQAGELFRSVMSDDERTHTVTNIVGAMKGISGTRKDEIIQRQLFHFHKVNPKLAKLVAEGLAVTFKPE